MSKKTLFFSWNSKNKKHNRRLKKTIENICEELEIEYDESTRNVPGSPNIVETIKEKIKKCDIFIADITPVTEFDGEDIPNTNVMIEYGYCRRGLDDKNIILTRTDEENKNNLPFDISQNRYSPVTKKNMKEKLTEYIELVLKESPDISANSYLSEFKEKWSNIITYLSNYRTSGGEYKYIDGKKEEFDDDILDFNINIFKKLSPGVKNSSHRTLYRELNNINERMLKSMLFYEYPDPDFFDDIEILKEKLKTSISPKK